MSSFCYPCLRPFNSQKGLKIHEARSTKHYIAILDIRDPDHEPIENYFENYKIAEEKSN